MTKILSIVLIFSAVSLQGCGTYVVMKDGKKADPVKLSADSEKCEQKAAMLYPFVPVVSSYGGYSNNTVEDKKTKP